MNKYKPSHTAFNGQKTRDLQSNSYGAMRSAHCCSTPNRFPRPSVAKDFLILGV